SSSSKSAATTSSKYGTCDAASWHRRSVSRTWRGDERPAAAPRPSPGGGGGPRAGHRLAAGAGPGAARGGRPRGRRAGGGAGRGERAAVRGVTAGTVAGCIGAFSLFAGDALSPASRRAAVGPVPVPAVHR